MLLTPLSSRFLFSKVLYLLFVGFPLPYRKAYISKQRLKADVCQSQERLLGCSDEYPVVERYGLR